MRPKIFRRHGYNKTISGKWEEFKHSVILKPIIYIGMLIISWLLRKQEIKQYELCCDYQGIKDNCNNNYYWIKGFKIFFKFLEQDNAYKTFWSKFKENRREEYVF